MYRLLWSVRVRGHGRTLLGNRPTVPRPRRNQSKTPRSKCRRPDYLLTTSSVWTPNIGLRLLKTTSPFPGTLQNRTPYDLSCRNLPRLETPLTQLSFETPEMGTTPSDGNTLSIGTGPGREKYSSSLECHSKRNKSFRRHLSFVSTPFFTVEPREETHPGSIRDPYLLRRGNMLEVSKGNESVILLVCRRGTWGISLTSTMRKISDKVRKSCRGVGFLSWLERRRKTLFFNDTSVNTRLGNGHPSFYPQTEPLKRGPKSRNKPKESLSKELNPRHKTS